MKDKRKKIDFPNDFFTTIKKITTNEKALKDVIPFTWSKDVLNGKKKAILTLTKKNDNL